MKRKPRKWKMWALINEQWAEWGFDVYHSKAEALRLRGAGERIKLFEVRELPRRKR